MAAKYAPFTITYSFTGKKTADEISKAYQDFYLQTIKQGLNDSNLSDTEKKTVINRLLSHHSQSNQET